VDAFVIVDIVELCAHVSHHKCIGSEDGGRNGRGSVNRQERTNCRKLAVDFFFLNVEEAGDVFDHLLVRESHFFTGRTVRRRGGDDVGGVASAMNGRGGAGWDEDGR